MNLDFTKLNNIQKTDSSELDPFPDNISGSRSAPIGPLQIQANKINYEMERNNSIFKKYQDNIRKSETLQAEITKGRV